jgi:uncharacterized protein YdiU (UPF0061 family)
VLRAKLGLVKEADGDVGLAADLFERLRGVDFTIFFRCLCASAADPSADGETAALFGNAGAFRDWAETWRKRLAIEDVAPEIRAAAMRRANPAFIPRNHRVEEMIRAAVDEDDYAPFETLLSVVTKPYEDQPAFAHLAEAPRPEQVVFETFCGT